MNFAPVWRSSRRRTARSRSRLRDLLLTQLADMQRRFDSPLYAAQTGTDSQAPAPFDIIQIESLEMAAYLPVIRRVQPQTPVIYDSFNAEFDLQRSIYQAERRNLRRLPGAVYSFIQWRRLIRFEREVCETVAHTIAVSDADADVFPAAGSRPPGERRPEWD